MITLRSAKIENEAKLEYQSERIRALTAENESFVRSIASLEQRLGSAYEQIEQNNMNLKESEQRLNQLRLNVESDKARIKCLESEK